MGTTTSTPMQSMSADVDEKRKALEDFVNGSCACYLPDQVYSDYADNFLSQMGTTDPVITNYVKSHAQCFFPPCGATSSQFARDKCAENLQICSQSAKVDVNGNVVGNISPTQIIDCRMNISKEAKTSTEQPPTTTEPPTTTNTDSVDNTLLYIVAGIVVLVILIIVFLLSYGENKNNESLTQEALLKLLSNR